MITGTWANSRPKKSCAAVLQEIACKMGENHLISFKKQHLESLFSFYVCPMGRAHVTGKRTRAENPTVSQEEKGTGQLHSIQYPIQEQT